MRRPGVYHMLMIIREVSYVLVVVDRLLTCRRQHITIGIFVFPAVCFANLVCFMSRLEKKRARVAPPPPDMNPLGGEDVASSTEEEEDGGRRLNVLAAAVVSHVLFHVCDRKELSPFPVHRRL